MLTNSPFYYVLFFNSFSVLHPFNPARQPLLRPLPHHLTPPSSFTPSSPFYEFFISLHLYPFNDSSSSSFILYPLNTSHHPPSTHFSSPFVFTPLSPFVLYPFITSLRPIYSLFIVESSSSSSLSELMTMVPRSVLRVPVLVAVPAEGLRVPPSSIGALRVPSLGRGRRVPLSPPLYLTIVLLSTSSSSCWWQGLRVLFGVLFFGFCLVLFMVSHASCLFLSVLFGAY